MASFNRVILIGNLTRDPELKHIPSGTAVCEFSLAVNDKVKRNNEWVDEVSFFDCVTWGRTAEVVCEHLSKGSGLMIEGRLKQQRWEDKDSGAARSKVKINVERMQFMPKRGRASDNSDDGPNGPDGPPPSGSGGGDPGPDPGAGYTDADIPF